LFGVPLRLPKNSFMETFNLSKDLLRFYMQRGCLPRDLTLKAPQSDCSSKVDEDGVEGNLATNITPGTKRRETGTGRASFMQEPIMGGVKGCETSGGGVFDHHRETAGQDTGRMEKDKSIFPDGILSGAGQYHTLRQQRKPGPYFEPICFLASSRIFLHQL
jgi:hypothetical protein